MSISKEDFYLSEKNKKYRLFVRKKVFWFLYTWVPVTQQETEYSEEKPIEFDTICEANKFMKKITK